MLSCRCACRLRPWFVLETSGNFFTQLSLIYFPQKHFQGCGILKTCFPFSFSTSSQCFLSILVHGIIDSCMTHTWLIACHAETHSMIMALYPRVHNDYGLHSMSHGLPWMVFHESWMIIHKIGEILSLFSKKIHQKIML